MGKMLKSRFMRSVAWVLIVATTTLFMPVGAFAAKRHKVYPKKTDRFTQDQLRYLANKARKMVKVEDVKDLSSKELKGIYGRGQYRNRYFCSQLPWHRSFKDANLVTGNLFKSFTDIQVSPARGAGLVLQRTYNSNDNRIGPFGRGWTHAYDLRMEEASIVDELDPTSLDIVDRVNFFGGRERFKRDADGLYTPPNYMHNWLESDYNSTLASGPTEVLADKDVGLDGTTKYFEIEDNSRVCKRIVDKWGNETVLSYSAYPGIDYKLLTQVTDPCGRTLTFTWTLLDSSDPDTPYRITQVDGPLQKVVYEYYTPGDPLAGGERYNLRAVCVDPGPGHLNRTTTFTYTSCEGETGLLSRITDPAGQSEAGHYIQYSYGLGPYLPGYGYLWAEPTVWVLGIEEPAGVDQGGGMRTRSWEICQMGYWYVPGPIGTILIEKDLETPGPDPWMHQQWIGVYADEYLRVIGSLGYGSMVEGQYGRFTTYFTEYDSANNVTAQWNILAGRPIWDLDPNHYHQVPVRKDCYEYTRLGNVKTHQVAGFHEIDGYLYHDESKYFQKRATIRWNSQSDKDHDQQYLSQFPLPRGSMRGRVIEEYEYGSRYETDPTQNGNKGNVLWARDARYLVTGEEYTYTYNTYGQKKSETNLNNVVTEYTYGDQWGNLTKVAQDPTGLNRVTEMSYDDAGKVLTKKDPNGRTSSMTYYTDGQPYQVNFPATPGTPAETITYTYGANGRLDTVADNRGVTSISYEFGCDRVSSVSDPTSGAISYTYDPCGNVKTKTLPGGRTLTYKYTYGTEDYFWGDPDNDAMYVYVGFYTHCQVWPKDDPNSIQHELTQVIDDEGRIVYYNQTSAGGVAHAEFNQTYKLDPVTGNPIVDQWGRPERTSFCTTDYYYEGHWSSDTLPYDFEGEAGMKPYYTHGQTKKVVTKFHWVEINELEQEEWHEKVIADNMYDYDHYDNRWQNTITLRDENDQVSIEREVYGYDELNRLTGVDYQVFQNNQYQTYQTQTYQFDPMGNRLQKNDSLTGVENYTYNNANMLMQRNSDRYAYDCYNPDDTFNGRGNGNNCIGGGRTYIWDSQNRLVECEFNGKTTTSIYGADGLRRSSVVDSSAETITTNYLLDGQSVVQESVSTLNKSTSQTENSTVIYLNGPRGPEYRRVDINNDGTTDTIRWYLYDGLGSVIGELGQEDVNHNVVKSIHKYDVYGAIRSGSGTSTSKHKFVGGIGHTSEDSTDLIYMRARYYDPSIGRFINQDPEYQGMNWYSYCDGNPVNRADVNGRNWEALEKVLDWVSSFHDLAENFGIGVSAAGHFLKAALFLKCGIRLLILGKGLFDAGTIMVTTGTSLGVGWGEAIGLLSMMAGFYVFVAGVLFEVAAGMQIYEGFYDIAMA